MYRRWGTWFVLLLLPAAVAAGGCEPLPRGVEPPPGVHARGLLWRVTSPAGSVNHLLGTMHLADPRVLDVLRVVRPVLAASRAVALEVVLDEAAMAALQSAMFEPAGGSSLDDLLGEPLYRRTAGYLARHGIPAEVAPLLKPWAAFTVLSQPPGAAGGVPLDLALAQEARAGGRGLHGLETVAEQLALFETLPAGQALAMLREVVCHYDLMQTELEHLVRRYAARDLAGLLRASFKYVDRTRLPLMDRLLWQRNERMVARMEPLLGAGGTLVAVGALHLTGERGLLELLTRRGYRVEAVY